MYGGKKEEKRNKGVHVSLALMCHTMILHSRLHLSDDDDNYDTTAITNYNYNNNNNNTNNKQQQ